jgi:hypothetical protein
MRKHRKPPRCLTEAEFEGLRQTGGLRDPGHMRQPPLPDGSPNPDFRTSALLCRLVCEREHCRRNRRCMHRVPLALKENMHWLLRAYYEYKGWPIPPQVLAVERAYQKEIALPQEPAPEKSEVDPRETHAADQQG